MQHAGDMPAVPTWFTSEVLAMIAAYPGQQAGRATVAAYWKQLHRFDPAAIMHALEKAPASAEDKRFPPSAFVVLDHAKAWRPPTQRPNLDLPALPEAEPDLPPELAEIREAQKAGGLSPSGAARAYLRWVIERLP